MRSDNISKDGKFQFGPRNTNFSSNIFFPGSISNAANITIYQTVNERFLEVFRDHVEQNPRQSGENEELEPCIGCMSETANIKLIRRCTGNGNAAAGKEFSKL